MLRSIPRHYLCHEAAEELRTLKIKLNFRKQLNFLPHEAEKEKLNLSVSEQEEIQLELVVFYGAIIHYIELWENSYDVTENFQWLYMSRFPEWEVIINSYEFAVLRYGEDLKTIINRDQL